MKKSILLFATLLCMTSCSFVDSKTKEEIDQKVAEAKTAIVKAGEEQVKNAKTRIENEIATSVTKASDNIDTLVKASIKQIEQATDQKVQQAIDKEVNKLKEDLNTTKWIALTGILFAILGILCGVLSLLKLKDSNLKDSVVEYVTQSERINMFLRAYIDDRKPQTKTAGVSQEDVRTIVKELISSDPKILESIAKQIDKTATQAQVVNAPTLNVEQSVTKVESQPVQRFELYARDSTTRVLSDIFPLHQKGKTIYKLIMDSPNSTTATLDLCTDKEDAVGRILRFNNEDIESICTVSRNSDRPEKVRVLKRGKAEKVGSSEWNVTEKIEIELS